MNEQLYNLLLEDPRRQVRVNGLVCHCEGQAYIKHECQGPLDLNEVLVTRRVFQKLSDEKKAYFFHEYNCSLNCRWFQMQIGHSRDFRRWFMNERVSVIYGGAEIANWIGNSPLRYKTINLRITARKTARLPKEEIESRLKNGETQRSIACSFGISHQLLHYYIRKWGIKSSRKVHTKRQNQED